MKNYFSVTMSYKIISLTLNIDIPNKTYGLIFEKVCIQGKKGRRKVRLFSQRRGMGLYNGESLFRILRLLSIRINKTSNHESINGQ